MKQKEIANLASEIRDEVNIILTKMKDVPTGEDLDDKDLVFLQDLKHSLLISTKNDELFDEYESSGDDYYNSSGLDE